MYKDHPKMVHNYAVVVLMSFFRDILRISNMKGGGIRKYQKLDPRIAAAIICKHCMLFDLINHTIRIQHSFASLMTTPKYRFLTKYSITSVQQLDVVSAKLQNNPD